MKKWIIAGGLIVALLGLCATMLVIVFLAIRPLSASGVRIRLLESDTISATAAEEQRFEVKTPATLEVHNQGAGAITITGGEGSEIVVTANKTAWGPSKEQAEADLEALKVTIMQDGNTVTVKVEQPEEITFAAGRFLPDSVDFTIRVPGETAVTAYTESGEVKLSGAQGAADLQTSFGAVEATDVTGDLKISTSSGEITAQHIRAGKASVSLHSDFGNIELTRAEAQDVTVGADSGTLTLREVAASGVVTLDAGFGRISFDTGEAKSLSVTTQSGAVELLDLTVSEGVTVKSEFGDLTLRECLAAAYNLNTSSGKITVEVAGGKVTAHTSFGDIDITRAENATLDVKTSSGAIGFSGSLGEGPHVIETSFGNITLGLPAGSALTVDLETDFGKVKSDLPIQLNDLDEKHWRGAINGGGASLTVTTNNGNITLETLK